MEVKMESEQSYSSESSSSSETSTGSSEGEEEVMETIRVLGQTLELPQELCEDYALFKEFFSIRTWEALEDPQKDLLKKYLPNFPQEDEEEKDKTIKMIFNFEHLHFSSPVENFYNNLKNGNYRPDIAKMRKFLSKARAKQQKHKMKSYYAKLLPEVLLSRERLLAAVKASPPGLTLRLPHLPPRPSSKNSFKPLYLRARQRYFEELKAIRSEVGGDESDDENYPEGPPEEAYRRSQKKPICAQNSDVSISGTLSGMEISQPNSLECLKNALAAHRSRRHYRENHPELNTVGLSLDDIKQRVALVNGSKKLMFGGPKSDNSAQKMKRAPKKEPGPKVKIEGKGKKGKEEPDSLENRPLLPNIKIKTELEDSDSEMTSYGDPVNSTRLLRKSMEQLEIKQEVDVKYPSNINLNDPKLESTIKQEPIDAITQLLNASRIVQPVPIKLEDLDGIDMMALPVEIADDTGEVVQVNTSRDAGEEPLVDADESLTETTHANFMSLVRALFPARAAHRASKAQLHARCAAVMRSPIAPLNTWYSLSDDWCSELDSALEFLAGERGPHPDDFVPYLQFMPETQMYQWIGAGRDCDSILGRLCERWLRAASPPPPATDPPPPKYPTNWVVRPPTNAEIVEFRAQERRRFSSAAKPFTYTQHGYKSVVGPCARSMSLVSGHLGLLAPDRPRHAHFMALVRDAVARLPNGEGTRHDVLTLLKMSQWIEPCAEQVLLSAVSSALDRLHSAKRDPMVKYDQRTAVWTYLHRHRTEDDWAKGSARRTKAVSTPPTAPPQLNRAAAAQKELAPPASPHALEMGVASVEEVVDNGSDTDVDVDGSGSPTSTHMSSAQLLMQATQATQAKQPPQTKSKGKLVPVSPQKAKVVKAAVQAKPNVIITKPNPPVKQSIVCTKQPVTKQSVSASPKQPPAKPNVPTPAKPAPAATIKTPPTQPAKQTSTSQTKQASLMAQSAKQASVIAQLTKQLPPKPQVQTKQVTVVKQPTQSPKLTANVPKAPQVKQTPSKEAPAPPRPEVQRVIQPAKSLPSLVATPQKSPLIKQRPLQKHPEMGSAPMLISAASVAAPPASTTVLQPAPVVSVQSQPKPLAQGTRSLLIRAPSTQTAATAIVSTPINQTTAPRRGVVRVLSPATQAGKSLISPRSLLHQVGTSVATTKKRSTPHDTSVTTLAQSPASATVVSSVSTAVTSSVPTRTVQLAGGRTVQLSNQTVQLPGGQTVQLTSGHTLLSSLQLPTHSVRLPSGQTVQLATQAVQAVRAATSSVKTSPRPQSSPTIKTSTALQIPISSVQLAGQTVQIGGQTVQLTGHTVKLPSGQSVQVASQSVLPSQSVQLPSGQTVQLASGTVLGQNVLANQSVQMGGQSVQLGSQTVQLGGQTVQLAGQTVQLPSGQTLQLTGGQTVQLPGGQTIQLAGQVQKPVTQVVRSQASGDKATQPIVAKLLTNAQGQMISLEGAVGAGVSGGVSRALVSGVRVVPAATRVSRPLLLTAAKPLHNIILQQSDGSAIRVTSTGGASTSQTIVISNIGAAQSVTTSATTTTPILKLQQVNQLQQVKLPQGIKFQQGVASNTVPTSAVRSVLMDGQHLKLVGGRHVLARILRPAQQPPPQ